MTITDRRGGRLRLVAGLAALALTATACGGDDSDTDASGSTGASGGSGDCGPISLGFIPSWTDGLSTSYLWRDVLEHRGHQVEFVELSEAAPLYAGLAGGDIDVFTSAAIEITHEAYMDEYSDRVEDLGTWYEGMVNTLAVPEYTPIDSIPELAADADRFDGRIIGIEPGSGLSRMVKESVLPTYELEAAGFTLVESSTVAMLAELQSAIDAQEDVVVTLWHPFWAYSQFPMKDLADPEGAFADPEGLHVLAREGFSDDCADVAELMGELELSDVQYADLEDTVVNQYGEGRYAEGVEAWLEANPEIAETLKG